LSPSPSPCKVAGLASTAGLVKQQLGATSVDADVDVDVQRRP
jgi:hypothetical protein